MKFVPTQRLVSLAMLAALTCGAQAQEAPVTPAASTETPVGSDQALDLGTKVPDSTSIKEGLFPEDACKELEASGFKCMGFRPTTRFALPATSFKVGSAEIPDSLKTQLEAALKAVAAAEAFTKEVVEGTAQQVADEVGRVRAGYVAQIGALDEELATERAQHKAAMEAVYKLIKAHY